MTAKHLADTARLHNGVEMPWFGLGVWRAEDGPEVENMVRWAVECGYRSIDTAAMYRNETSVGRAVRDCGVPREEIFLTTKVWNDDHGYDATLRAFDESLKRLDLDQVDLYLIHWPVRERYVDTWRALEAIYASGCARAIGTSNFKEHHLETLRAQCEIVPMVNQMEFHPRLQVPELRRYCREQGIQFEAWRPLMLGEVMKIPELRTLGEKHEKTPAQITLRWMLQRGVVTIPKSSRRERIVENADIFDFALTAQDLAVIDGLNCGGRLGADPDEF